MHSIANATIKPPVPVANLRKKDYRTGDIISLVQEVIRSDTDDTAVFARHFERNRKGLRKLFDFVDTYFTYVEDPPGSQWVQTPSYIWATKQGDCKSFTVFISSVLQNIGIPHIIRYVAYGTLTVKHVYPVALLDGEEITLDVVYRKQQGGLFGEEKPYTFKKDYYVEGLYKLGTVDAVIENNPQALAAVERTFGEMAAAMADVPDSIITAGPGDVTQWTAGRLDRYIWQDRYEIYARQAGSDQEAQEYRAAAQALAAGSVAGIGALAGSPLGRQVQDILTRSSFSTRPAFTPFTLELDLQPAVGGILQDIGKFFTNLWKKFVNWIFKGAAKKMASYFIFLFIKRSKVKSQEILRRQDEQVKTFNWIAKTGRLDSAQLLGTVMNGIKDDTGMAPQDILNRVSAVSAQKQIAGIGDTVDPLPTKGGTVTPPAPTGAKDFEEWKKNLPPPGEIAQQQSLLNKILGFVIKAIGFVIEVIKKVVSLFKKKESDAGKVNKENSSDVIVLAEEMEKERTPDPASASDTPAAGGAGWLGLAATAAGLLFAFR